MSRLESPLNKMIRRFHADARPTEDPITYVRFESHGPFGDLIRMTRNQVIEYLRPETCQGTRALLRQMNEYRCESECIFAVIGDAQAPFEVRSEVIHAER